MDSKLIIVVISIFMFITFDVTQSKSLPSVTVLNCSALGGYRPIEILNSRYQILQNGTLCCPLDRYDSNGQDRCIPKEEIEDVCGEKGLEYEPCFHCFTCAKVLGESCKGLQFTHGLCRSKDLECIGTDIDEAGVGACTTKGGPPQNKTSGERCGGKFDSLGICGTDYECIKNNNTNDGICTMKGENYQS